ncbi:hypothetical protein B0H14DRAFT_465317 [Mycena olivaceomarginata]|nr:hypothetical protein B0H14DRAFT_465317 [Mycena olivaceomarginata]
MLTLFSLFALASWTSAAPTIATTGGPLELQEFIPYPVNCQNNSIEFPWATDSWMNKCSGIFYCNAEGLALATGSLMDEDNDSVAYWCLTSGYCACD